MKRLPPIHGRLAGAGAVLAAALMLSACGTTVSTSKFKGAQHEVAQTLANLQSHANSAELDKICTKDVTAELLQKLKGKSECEQAFKRQLAQTDSLELTVESVTVHAAAATPKAKAKSTTEATATATVKSKYEGKNRVSEVQLVKQGGTWRIAALGAAPAG